MTCFHYHSAYKKDKYIVWQENTQGNTGYGDGKPTTKTIDGTIDYFTLTEYDSNKELIEQALIDLGIAWRLNSIQYEDDTGYIHYEWTWEMII